LRSLGQQVAESGDPDVASLIRATLVQREWVMMGFASLYPSCTFDAFGAGLML
jgi:hypothetical protein